MTEPQQDENQLINIRLEKLQQIKAKGPAYPNDFRRSHYANQLQASFGELTKEELAEANIEVKIAGRIMLQRGPFSVLQDSSGRIQFYTDRKLLEEEKLKEVKAWDLGDLVGISGTLQKSGKGDLYVLMHSPSLLNKTLRPLPDKHKGLADQEQRYRQRYVDLMVNEQSRNTFLLRSRIVSAIRHFLQERGFLEVETPMLQVIPGGATARPFITHHNSMDMDMYLRIAPELYLKRLVVGGFEKVFEINRNFRNEGVSTRHNPEFTMLEFYQAYACYLDLMDLSEEMLREVAVKALGSTQLSYQGLDFDLANPFARLSMYDSILAYNPDIAADDLADLLSLRKLAERLQIGIKDSYGYGKLLTEVFEARVEDKLMQPTFITHYPAEVSPLAKRFDDNPEFTERFEFFLAGREVANGFSELNDPIDQAERFKAQVMAKDEGDDEAMFYDADYIRALEYGMPPTAGQGIGIDRLVMFFTDSSTIKDVILFPHMKPETK